MANTDKNIVITPNNGATGDPQIVFSGADASTAAQNITLKVYPTNSGTLSIEGSAGQLFSVTNELTGSLFAVNDISGLPQIEVLDTGVVKLSQYGGRVVIGTTSDDGISALQVNGTITALRLENIQTASYTLALSDRDKVVVMNSASATTITIPTNATVPFPVGSLIYLYRLGAGTVTLAAASGVTSSRTGTLALNEELYLRKRGTDDWVVVDQPRALSGTGGNSVATINGYKTHTFTSGGTLTIG